MWTFKQNTELSNLVTKYRSIHPIHRYSPIKQNRITRSVDHSEKRTSKRAGATEISSGDKVMNLSKETSSQDLLDDLMGQMEEWERCTEATILSSSWAIPEEESSMLAPNHIPRLSDQLPLSVPMCFLILSLYKQRMMLVLKDLGFHTGRDLIAKGNEALGSVTSSKQITSLDQMNPLPKSALLDQAPEFALGMVYSQLVSEAKILPDLLTPSGPVTAHTPLKMPAFSLLSPGVEEETEMLWDESMATLPPISATLKGDDENNAQTDKPATRGSPTASTQMNIETKPVSHREWRELALLLAVENSREQERDRAFMESQPLKKSRPTTGSGAIETRESLGSSPMEFEDEIEHNFLKRNRISGQNNDGELFAYWDKKEERERIIQQMTEEEKQDESSSDEEVFIKHATNVVLVETVETRNEGIRKQEQILREQEEERKAEPERKENELRVTELRILREIEEEDRSKEEELDRIEKERIADEEMAQKMKRKLKEDEDRMLQEAAEKEK
ncbi:hypothetical protein BLNAU_19978 [Blattamonas nauphoetae]|uniref:Uncharacterized protein n=1 Tax=Blattamonas nauphoetae TaxID=2049346 RepID=A0ABQ9WZZ8_9EUKA|nr:hypothetical protein BLNAU_19978 [Blattamonas nauphoetae]